MKKKINQLVALKSLSLFLAKSNTFRNNSYLIFGLFIIVCSLISVSAQQAPIVVTADQPNVWTLEQAHYLIAQMHRRNLDLKASPLADLDANQINAINVEALKTLLGVSAEYDQSVGKNNKDIANKKEYQVSRTRELTARRDRLQEDSLTLTRQIAELKIKKLKAETQEEKDQIQAQIEELTIVKEAVNEQITQINAQLSAISSDASKYESLNLSEGTFAQPPTNFDGVFNATAKNIIEQFNNQSNNSPQLNATLRLENYLQMQYEILSKQLTLLRDEVGAGERLIFLEIPQSINSSYGKANHKWAQTWWKVTGYSQCIVYKNGNRVVPCSKVLDKTSSSNNRNKLTTSEIVEQIVDEKNQSALLARYESSLLITMADVSDYYLDFFFSEDSKTDLAEQLSSKIKEDQNLIALKRQYDDRKQDSSKKRLLKVAVVNKLNEYIVSDYNLDVSVLAKSSPRVATAQQYLPDNSKLFRRIVLAVALGGIEIPPSPVQTLNPLDSIRRSENRSVRIVDLFPRQSSLNVNDVKLRSSATTLKGLFQVLSGFGAKIDYQRTRERYSQYVQQELYSSAFGKGSREFGWTFNPMPGTKRLLSGVRTTYAIMVIPEDASAIKLEARGCYFTRNSSQPSNFDDTGWNLGESKEKSGCSVTKEFLMPIPDGGNINNNAFDVTEITYEKVRKGQRAVVTIYGSNFSSQIGVLVNGVPLTQALGLGQPFIRDDRKTTREEAIKEIPTNEVSGSFERISPNQIVTSFKMDKDYEGTPTITLVSPGRALDLNQQNLVKVIDKTNNSYSFISLSDSPKIFSDSEQIFDANERKYNTVLVNNISAFLVNNKLKIIITGKYLNDVTKVYANGKAIYTKPAPTPVEVYLIETDDGVLPFSEKEKSIQITLLTKNGTINANPIDNPSYKKETMQTEVINYIFDSTKFTIKSKPKLLSCEKKDNDSIATFELKGKGFNEGMTAFIGKDEIEQPDFVSSDSGKLSLKNPKQTQIVEIRNKATKLKARVIVTFNKMEANCQ